MKDWGREKKITQITLVTKRTQTQAQTQNGTNL